MAKAMEQANKHMAEAIRRMPMPTTQLVDPPSYYGWLSAEIAERSGQLKVGDIKEDGDGKLTYWYRGSWVPLHKTGPHKN